MCWVTAASHPFIRKNIVPIGARSGTDEIPWTSFSNAESQTVNLFIELTKLGRPRFAMSSLNRGRAGFRGSGGGSFRGNNGGSFRGGGGARGGLLFKKPDRIAA